MKASPIRLIFIFLACLAICSCSTTTKIAIYGKPGTNIYDGGSLLGTIPSEGVLKHKMSDGSYTTCLLAEEPGSDIRVPFALDYKRNERKSAHVAGGISGVFFIPTMWIWPYIAMERLSQTAYDNAYEYLNYQQTNNDMVFTKPNIKYVNTTVDTPANKSGIISMKARPRSQSSTTKAIDSPTAATQKVSRHLGVSNITGTYKGTGAIKQGNNDVETLNGVSVEIEKLSPSQVKVRVTEANGNDFFGEPIVYNLEGNANGKVTLKHPSIGKAHITISPSGMLEFVNPAIEIDNVIYTLSIIANK